MPMANVRSEDFTHYVPYQVNTSSEHLGWHGFRVEVVRGHAPGEISLPPLDHHLLNMIVSAHTRHEHRWDGIAEEATGHEGTASLVPAGCESYWRWQYLSPAAAPCDFHIHLHPAFVRRVAVASLCDLPAAAEFRAELGFEHPQLHAMATALLHETEAGGPHGALYAESLATAITTLLLHRQETWQQAQHSCNVLPLQQIRTVCDYIEAHLGDTFHLEALGELAGLGPERFRQAFRSVLGETPHRYATRRRMERAREILRSTHLPVTEIALRLGYADHSHFTSTFRRELGITPSRFRAESAR